ncbi:hypothetical protein ACOMHN_017888 [Nucella lapillus]
MAYKYFSKLPAMAELIRRSAITPSMIGASRYQPPGTINKTTQNPERSIEQAEITDWEQEEITGWEQAERKDFEQARGEDFEQAGSKD